MPVFARCFAHLTAAMERCRQHPHKPCRAQALVPRRLRLQVERGVVSDGMLQALLKPAQTVNRCAWRCDNGCQVAGMFGAFLLIAGGEMAMPRGCSGGPCRNPRIHAART